MDRGKPESALSTARHGTVSGLFLSPGWTNVVSTMAEYDLGGSRLRYHGRNTREARPFCNVKLHDHLDMFCVQKVVHDAALAERT